MSLKELAEGAIKSTKSKDSPLSAYAFFRHAATPEAILALYAERDALGTRVDDLQETLDWHIGERIELRARLEAAEKVIQTIEAASESDFDYSGAINKEVAAYRELKP